MKKNLFSVKKFNPYQKEKDQFPASYKSSILYQNFLNKNLDENKELKLGTEIKKKKHEISAMFRNKFGRNFLNVKPDSLIIFQKLFGQYLFDPDSQFLAHFPKLQRILRHERKISEFKLKDKIDMGAMVYFDLKTKGKKKNKYIDLGKEKMLTISKNLEAAPTKDLVQEGINKNKFWDKNREKIEKFYKRNLIKNFNNFIKEQNENSQDSSEINSKTESNDENKEESDEKSSFNDSKNNDFKEKEIQNLKFTLGKSPKKNSTSDKNPGILILSELTDSDRKKRYENKNKDRENILNKTATKNNNKNFISSYKNGNIIPKLIDTKKKSRNISNFSGFHANSNTFRNFSYNVSNSKINESNNNNSNFLKTATNFNLSNSKGFTQRTTILNHYFPIKFSRKKKIASLKNKHYKFKNKLDNQITKLNQYTIKCNTELIKLIDINNDNNFKERKKKYLKRNKLDIKDDLIEKNQVKKIESDDDNNNDKNKEEKENEEQTIKMIEGEKDSVRIELQGARKDLNDKFGGKVMPQNREKAFKKKLVHISDEQALAMVEYFLHKKKELDIRKVLQTDSILERKKIREMKYIRLKTKKNYDKMIRLKNQIIIDKGKIFKELEKYDII